MAVRDDCMHYSTRSAMVAGVAEKIERCRLGEASEIPFACPDGCIFYEKRTMSTVGWVVDDDEEQEGFGAGNDEPT